MSSITGFRRRAAAVLGATALVVAAGVATAGPAAAGEDCDPGYHCAFWVEIGSAKHSYFNSDPNFTDDWFDGCCSPVNVNDRVGAASNSSTGGYESHYYKDIDYGGGLLFCVNPGSQVRAGQLQLWQTSQASSLKLRPTTTVPCF
ncbi:hypothetical protein [Streptomyces hydrogenans]|uniref:Peptidase inhibitor family I36 n=1 Tax=Streptomyces hydrogenans TaxID=1873719 RepID=A0ABQ3P8E0_9ACTN|nr:hypothetical protein [Streptomyces hydrogenans]GHG18752.1 hypothetical protein GCM10018784_34990 [Streptomyces hydrogenans]GHI21294.1 hypothetical protein Shyd_26650 [Streptomyces hydrogenans]